MIKILLVIIFGCSVIYTIARYKNAYTTLRIIQPITTILIALLAALGLFTEGHNLFYTQVVILALVFALVGDCNLIDLNDNTTFLIAVGFYWGGLVTYSVLFTYLTGFNLLDLGAFILLIIVTAVTFALFLWKGLGKLKIPIIIYAVTWCCLMSQTLTIFWSDSGFFSSTQAWLILAGTGSYFLGDLNLSFHKFNARVSKKPYWLGAALYCVGQTLVALSTSFFSVQ